MPLSDHVTLSFATTPQASLIVQETCHPELCHDAAASLIVQETCHSEPERSGGEACPEPGRRKSRCLMKIEILASFVGQDDM